MKRRLAFAFVLALSLLALCCNAAVPDDYVEISFKVGDSTLNINGEDVNVETPYVVGEGVTLVPVRVITEAFGAEVDWDGTERKVTLTTEDKKIELWIGKTEAKTNGENLSLLSAPEISNNVTMVPLRFISEGFGAEVSYENETKSVKVVLDKGPVIKDGMQYFDDGIIDVSVPQNYVCVSDSKTEKGISYKFVKALEKNYSDYGTVWNYCFLSPKLEDAKRVIDNDRSLQTDLIQNKVYAVSKVEKVLYNDVEVYSYEITYEKNAGSLTMVRKTLYSFGEYSYFAVAVYDGYYNTGITVRDDSGAVTGIEYSSYSLVIPEAFHSHNEPEITSLDISGNAGAGIEVSIYKSEDAFDVKAFLEAEEESYRDIISQRTVSASSVKEYEFDGKMLSGYELSYVNGGKTYNIIYPGEGYFVYFRLATDNFDRAEDIIQSFEFNRTKENLEKLRSYDEKEYVSFETERYTFEYPSCFEVLHSDDGKLLSAVDDKTDMTLNFYYDTATVACETYDVATIYNPYTNPFSNVVDMTKYVREKKELSNLASDMMKLYEKNGWEVQGERMIEGYRINDVNKDIPFDILTCKSYASNSVAVYQCVVLFMTDTDADDLSKSDKRVEEVLKYADDDEKDDICDQKVHCLVFTFTDLSNEKNVKNVVKTLIDSIKLK